MGIRRLNQKRKKYAALKAELTLIRQQEKKEARFVETERLKAKGQVLDKLLESGKISQQEYIELLDGLVTRDYQRELFEELPSSASAKKTLARKDEQRKLILNGRILEKWLEWEKFPLIRSEFTKDFSAYLTRNHDRELFGLPLLPEENAPIRKTVNADSDNKEEQKLIIMGRFLEKRWIKPGKFPQIAQEYQRGIEAFCLNDNDRALFGLAPLLQTTTGGENQKIEEGSNKVLISITTPDVSIDKAVILDDKQKDAINNQDETASKAPAAKEQVPLKTQTPTVKPQKKPTLPTQGLKSRVVTEEEFFGF